MLECETGTLQNKEVSRAVALNSIRDTGCDSTAQKYRVLSHLLRFIYLAACSYQVMQAKYAIIRRTKREKQNQSGV
jgi:hypothetical protein